MRVPDIQVGHLGEVAHRLPVAGHGGGDDLAAVLAAEPVAAGRDFHAGGQPLDVPFPRAGRRLIEVVDVEDQQPLRGAEDAEVRQVRIPAGLHGQPGHRGTGQVAGHRQRRAAVVGERGHHHPAPPDRHQLRHPRLRLLFQQADRVGPVRPRVEHRVAFPRHRHPRFLPPLHALRRGQPVQPGLELVAVPTPGRSLSRLHTHHRLLSLRFAPHPLGVVRHSPALCPARRADRRRRRGERRPGGGDASDLAFRPCRPGYLPFRRAAVLAAVSLPGVRSHLAPRPPARWR